jgi:hypothetical protein
LIDGDILCYKASSVTDGKHYLIHYEYEGLPIVLRERYAKDADVLMASLMSEGFTNIKRTIGYEPEPLHNALNNIEESIDSLKNNIQKYTDGIGPVRFFLSRHGSFREKLFPPYKNNREETRRPVHLEILKDHLSLEHAAECYSGLFEADDLMAMAQDTNSIICSVDKDLLQVPGHHYNFVKDKYQIVSETEGLINLYTQILTGDVADGIPGLAGVGPKTAEKLLKGLTSEQEMYRVVFNKYVETVPKMDIGLSLETEGFHESIMTLINTNANLLYLRRSLEDKGWTEPLGRT